MWDDSAPIGWSSCAAPTFGSGSIRRTSPFRRPPRCVCDPATVLAALASADAHLTTSAELKVEDRLKKFTAEATGDWPPRPEPSALGAIDRTLLTLDVPDEEWDVLYRLRLQAERDALRRALGEMTTEASLHVEPPLRATVAEAADDVGARREPHVAQVPAL